MKRIDGSSRTEEPARSGRREEFMKHGWATVVLVSCAPALFSACGRENEARALRASYLGQTPPGKTAEVFARGIVTTPDHEHSRIEFSKDGRMLFWAVMPAPPGSADQHMRFVELTEEGWSAPARPVFLDDPNCGSPTFSADGGTFYYVAKPPPSAEGERRRGQSVWEVKRNGTRWEKPRVVSDLLPVFPGKVTMAFCFAGNRNLYFDVGGPDESGEWSWDIYSCEYQNGAYVEPEGLGDGINASRTNWCPFVAADESYLIFSSDRARPEDFGDLYITFRETAGGWTDPVNMGPAVNTGSQERFPSLSPDGKYLFFARNTDETYSDIYWVDAAIIEDLRPGNAK